MNPLSILVLGSTAVYFIYAALAERQRFKLIKRTNDEITKRGYK